MNKKTEYTNSIFEESWWLDAVAGNGWDRIKIEKPNGDIAAAFPIYKTKYMGFKTLRVPPITQTLGIYIENTGAKLSKKLEKEKKLINQIISQLPHKYNYDFYLDIDNEYILPFLWNGFKVEPKYSYRIEDLSDIDIIWAGFKENIKTDIRKAQKRVRISQGDDIELLIKMQRKTFERQGRKLPFNESIIRKLDNELKCRDSRVLLYAYDDEDNVHAATYFVFDNNRCYYLLSGGDPDFRNSGATSLLLWEGIKLASNRVKIFDFEGSMIEDIERFVRSFGACPRVYYRVTKFNVILSMAEYMKPKIKKLLKYK